ncbi:MAG: ABC transporter permease [Deinococcales bacterium]
MATATASVQNESSSNKTLRRFTKHRAAMISSVILAILVLLAIFAPIVAPYAPDKIDASNLYAASSSQHWMGTDGLGRDVFSRVLHAGRVSLLVGVAVALLSAMIGVVMGLVAGYYSGIPWVLSVGTGSQLWQERKKTEGSSFLWRTGLRWLVWAVVVGFLLQITAQFASTFAGALAFLAWVVGGGLALFVAYSAFYKAIVVDIDSAISRLIDVMLSLPQIPFLLILAGLLANPDVALGNVLTGVFGELRSMVLIIFVLTIFGWLGTARVIRGLVLSLRQQEFTDAARAIGVSDWRIMLRHLLPNAVAPIIVQVTLDVGNNIVSEAALSFLGFGIQEPTASWGNMLSSAQEAIFQSPFTVFWPGLFILLTSLSINFLGDGLRDALDPRSRL